MRKAGTTKNKQKYQRYPFSFTSRVKSIALSSNEEIYTLQSCVQVDTRTHNKTTVSLYPLSHFALRYTISKIIISGLCEEKNPQDQHYWSFLIKDAI